MPTNSKPPSNAPRRVVADDLAVNYNGEVYYPHAGEWVEFKGRPSVGLYLRFMEMADASSKGIQELTPHVLAWDWTDDDGKPYPPPSVEVISGLPPEELKWLLTHASSDATPAKNGITPST